MAANISNVGGVGNTRFLKNWMGTWLTQELKRSWEVSDGRDISWEELGKLADAAPPFTSFVDPDDQGFYNPSDMNEQPNIDLGWLSWSNSDPRRAK